jgi:hypothetical protein
LKSCENAIPVLADCRLNLSRREGKILSRGCTRRSAVTFAGADVFGAFATADASSYANTEIGRVVAVAYLDAFTKLVNDVKTMDHDAKSDNVQQSVTMAEPGKLYAEPNNKFAVVRDLDLGTTLYATREKDKIWWKVSDELGNEGWGPSPLLQLAK